MTHSMTAERIDLASMTETARIESIERIIISFPRLVRN